MEENYKHYKNAKLQRAHENEKQRLKRGHDKTKETSRNVSKVDTHSKTSEGELGTQGILQNLKGQYV